MKFIIDLKDYVSPTFETSYYKGIPIDYLDTVRKIIKTHGYTCRVRYRGPRKNDGRSRFNQQSSCLKSFANTFTIYAR